MSFDRTPYQCPICQKWCTGAIAYRKHYTSCNKKKGGGASKIMTMKEFINNRKNEPTETE